MASQIADPGEPLADGALVGSVGLEAASETRSGPPLSHPSAIAWAQVPNLFAVTALGAGRSSCLDAEQAGPCSPSQRRQARQLIVPHRRVPGMAASTVGQAQVALRGMVEPAGKAERATAAAHEGLPPDCGAFAWCCTARLPWRASMGAPTPQTPAQPPTCAP